MSEVLEAFKAEFIKAAPVIVPALVGVIVAGFAWLQKRMSWVRDEMTASAVRQAISSHGDTATAALAAADELQKVPAKLRPKDVVEAVIAKANEQRASMAPPPLEERPAPSASRPIDFPSVAEARRKREAEDLDDEESGG